MKTRADDCRSDGILRRMSGSKQPPDPAVRLGVLVQAFKPAKDDASCIQLGDVVRVVHEFVDDDFREHCSIRSIQSGILNVVVDDPGLLYSLRRKYLFELRDVLSRRMASVSIKDIRFSVKEH